jgi:hypothetical protein
MRIFFSRIPSEIRCPSTVLCGRMPETSGLEVQARLREAPPDTKAIVMTARETPAIRTDKRPVHLMPHQDRMWSPGRKKVRDSG